MIAWERYAFMLELRLYAGLDIAIPMVNGVENVGTAPSIDYFHPGYDIFYPNMRTMDRLESDRRIFSEWEI